MKKADPDALCRKMNGLGFRDWPDRQVLKPLVCTPLWIEFKKPGKTSTDGQIKIQQKLRSRGHAVFECCDSKVAWRIYEEHRDEWKDPQ